MKELISWYFDNWYKIMVRPIYFYSFLEKSSYKDKAFSFVLLSSGVLAFFASIAAFILVIYQLISPVLLGVSGIKTLVIMPVFILLCLSFFSIVFLVILSFMVAVSAVLFGAAGLFLHFSAVRFGFVGDIKEIVKASYYSSAVLIVFCLVSFLALSDRFNWLNLQGTFGIGVNILMYGTILYLWGLWSIAVKKIYSMPRSIALSSTFFVVL